jgi:predicted dehydrogenase
MKPLPTRRAFLQQSTWTAAALAATTQLPRRARAADSPNEAVVLAVIGVNGRGRALAESFATIGGARVATICDVDERAVARTIEHLNGKQDLAPKGEGDLRRVLDDKSIDGIVVATPDHWHGPATIMACGAGKHVYVEKPCCHNPREGELMIAAARKNQRVVQVGMQRRSMPVIREVIQRVHSGDIGNVVFARGWYNANRKPIGHGKPAAVPSWLNYDLWQGPAPERPYQDNLIHYNWHWFWNWGTGELGNNGIHSLDICRLGLKVDYPTRVTAGGGKYFFHDDQETPDTQVVTWDYGDKAITWEGRNWHHHGFEGSTFGIAFYGDKGSLVTDGHEYKVYDDAGKQLAKENKGAQSHDPHLRDFLSCVRSGERPWGDIEEGHKSTLLCLLGNIAYRTGHTLDCDPTNGHIRNDEAAMALWGREYRAGWEPQV